MRAPEAVARWARLSVTPSERIGVISMFRYRKKAVNWPSVRCAWITASPPISSTAASPSCGRKPIAGL